MILNPLRKHHESRVQPRLMPNHWRALQVGIVRQVETAAVKASEGSRGPFERTLSAVYTAATMEAGDKADVGELAPAASGSGWTSAGLSAHLLVVVEGGRAPQGAPSLRCSPPSALRNTGLTCFHGLTPLVAPFGTENLLRMHQNAACWLCRGRCGVGAGCP